MSYGMKVLMRVGMARTHVNILNNIYTYKEPIEGDYIKEIRDLVKRLNEDEKFHYNFINFLSEKLSNAAFNHSYIHESIIIVMICEGIKCEYVKCFVESGLCDLDIFDIISCYGNINVKFMEEYFDELDFEKLLLNENLKDFTEKIEMMKTMKNIADLY
jgi:hypothetical protein